MPGPATGLAAAALLLLAGLSLVQCAKAPLRSSGAPRKVTIAVSTFPASGSVLVAHDLGYFRDEGLDATIRTYAAGRQALDAALIGTVDIATVAETPIARAVLDGKSPMVVATICEVDDANVIVGRRDRGISTASALKGTRVGVLPGTSADFFLHIYLVTSGLEQSDVTVVPLGPGDLVPALVQGRVDAVSAFAPFSFELQAALGGNAVVLAAPGLYTTMWNVAVRPDFARDDRESIVAFLRAIDRANDFMATHPAKAIRITAENTGTSARDLKRLWSDNRWTLKLDQTLILSLEDESRWMSGGKVATPDFLRYIDSSALRRVNPEGIGIVEPRS